MIGARAQLLDEDRVLVTDFEGQDHLLVTLRDLHQKLEAREAAGTFRRGTPLEQVADPEARIALALLADIDRVFGTRWPVQEKAESLRPVLARAESYLSGTTGGGTWQDRIDLSSKARRLLRES